MEVNFSYIMFFLFVCFIFFLRGAGDRLIFKTFQTAFIHFHLSPGYSLGYERDLRHRVDWAGHLTFRQADGF